MKKTLAFLLSLVMLLSMSLAVPFSGAFADEAPAEAAPAEEAAPANEAPAEEALDLDALKQQAKDGDAEAQYQLGASYLEGEKPDYVEALRWLRKAGEQDHCGAMIAMAEIYVFGLGVDRDRDLALGLLNRAIELGSVDAMLALGDGYLSFVYPSDDYGADAVACYEKAAELDSVDALLALCDLYYDGIKVDRDYEKVMTYAKKAAELGSTDGMVYVGRLYMEGKGVDADGFEALDWLYEAADENNSSAMIQLGVLYEFGKAGIKSDYEKAVDWYTQAAELEDTAAMLALCDFYRGEYKGNDMEKAEYWAEEAAKLGDGEAYKSLGSSAEYAGNGEAAVRYYEKAAAAGHRHAMYKLANLYEKGELVEKDETKAQEWLEKYNAAP